MSQQAIAEAIHQQLIEDQSAGSLWALLGGRIYHLQAPPDMHLPRLTVRIDADEPRLFFDGGSDVRVELTIEIEAEDAATLLAASDLAFVQLQHRTPAVAGFRHASIRAVDRGRMKTERDALKATSRWILTATTR